jgi:hypothetical protein
LKFETLNLSEAIMKSLGDILRDNALARLNHTAWFGDIVLVNGNTGAIDNSIENALTTLKGAGGKKGACVLVDSPAYRAASKSSPHALCDLALPVTVYEDALFNRGAGGTGKTVSRIAEEVIAVLHNAVVTPTAGALTLGNGDYRPQLDEDSGTLIITLDFHLAAGVLAQPRVPMPLITVSDDTVTISLAAKFAGAEIWYVTDDSWPAPDNPAATLYTQPFQPAEAGALVSAVAFLEGYQPGNVAVART